MSFPKRTTLRLVKDALVAAYDGVLLTTGGELRAGSKPDVPANISDDVLPYLLFDLGVVNFSPWNEWEELGDWSIPARLKVKGEPGEVESDMLDVVGELILRTRSILGLPIDETGALIPFSDKTASLFDGDAPKLFFLAQRGAPVIKSIQFLPSQGPYCEANIVFGVQSIYNFDPRTLGRMEKGVLGINPVDPGALYQDTTLPNGRGVRLLGEGDRIAVVAQSGQAPDLGNVPRSAPLDQVPKSVAGSEPRYTIRSVNVTPYSAALSVGSPTAQLSAIATYGNWATAYVTGQGQWSSTDQTVATVNAGLVTRVGAGSCSVSCVFNGVTSNAVAITCS